MKWNSGVRLISESQNLITSISEKRLHEAFKSRLETAPDSHLVLKTDLLKRCKTANLSRVSCRVEVAVSRWGSDTVSWPYSTSFE